jgi:hypothetical protein
MCLNQRTSDNPTIRRRPCLQSIELKPRLTRGPVNPRPGLMKSWPWRGCRGPRSNRVLLRPRDAAGASFPPLEKGGPGGVAAPMTAETFRPLFAHGVATDLAGATPPNPPFARGGKLGNEIRRNARRVQDQIFTSPPSPFGRPDQTNRPRFSHRMD